MKTLLLPLLLDVCDIMHHNKNKCVNSKLFNNHTYLLQVLKKIFDSYEY